MAEPVEIPQHFFKAKCQSPDCRTLLGGFHIPCDGGLIVFACGKCNKTSVFRNEKYGIKAALAGPLVTGPTEGQRRR
jgi:hypothetical protein